MTHKEFSDLRRWENLRNAHRAAQRRSTPSKRSVKSARIGRGQILKGSWISHDVHVERVFARQH